MVDLETHLFQGQKVKGQGDDVQKIVSAWVFALLRVLASSSCYLVIDATDSIPTSVRLNTAKDHNWLQ